MSPLSFAEAVLLTVAALLPIMNPFSTVPIFLSLTNGMTPGTRGRQALKACLYAFAILVTFLLLGGFIVDFFGISVPGIRVAGGLIIGFVGFRMLFPPPVEARPTAEDVDAGAADISFTPLAMPFLAGPGSISLVLSGAAEITTNHPATWPLIYTAVVIGMALTLLIAFITLRGSVLVLKALGQTGLDAMMKIFGFLLICIAMQFVMTGIGEFYGI